MVSASQTVGTHLQNIYGKFNVRNQPELIQRIMTGPAGNLLRVDGRESPPPSEYPV